MNAGRANRADAVAYWLVVVVGALFAAAAPVGVYTLLIGNPDTLTMVVLAFGGAATLIVVAGAASLAVWLRTRRMLQRERANHARTVRARSAEDAAAIAAEDRAVANAQRILFGRETTS